MDLEVYPQSAYHDTRREETDAVFCSEWNQQKLITPDVKRPRLSCCFMDTEVFRAAREGKIEALRQHGDRLHQMLTPTKNTVLHVYIASIGGARLTKSAAELLKSAEVVEEMLNMCQQLLLLPNESGDTALHLAARHGCVDIVGVLIQAAKVDWHGDLEEGISSAEVIYQFLIRRVNKEKNTALHEAVRFNHGDVVKILIREDPEFLYSANDAGETTIYMAAERGYSNVVFEILDTCKNLSYEGPDGLTALHAAAAYGNEQMTRRLLEKERTLAIAANVAGNTPLHFAAFYGHVSIVKQILEYDKSTAYIGSDYEIGRITPVHIAAYAGYVDVLKQFLHYCPDSFELVDVWGRNALHHAIRGNEGEVEVFVRNDSWLSSVLLNGKDSGGNTPLHHIAKSQKYEGLEFVGDSRVDKMSFNDDNMNALDIVLKSSFSQWKRDLNQGLRNFGARTGLRKPRGKDNNRKAPSIPRDIKEAHEEGSIPRDIKEAHLIMSTLIATVTFAAGFTVPGGYQSDKGPNQGYAVLTGNVAFQAFVITNTIAMCLSSCAVMIRFILAASRRTESDDSFYAALVLTEYALILMVMAFLTGTYAVLGHSPRLAIVACVIGCIFSFVLGIFMLSPSLRRFRKCVFRAYDRFTTWLQLDKLGV